MEPKERIIKVFVSSDGRSPIEEWLRGIKDDATRARIRTRISRLRTGNFGDTKSLRAGVYELRLDFGPGYRIYYAIMEQTIVLLLNGGNKSSQKKDIEKAISFWQEFKHGNEHSRLH